MAILRLFSNERAWGNKLPLWETWTAKKNRRQINFEKGKQTSS